MEELVLQHYKSYKDSIDEGASQAYALGRCVHGMSDGWKHLNSRVAEVARKAGIKELTEVQEQAIPKVLSGRHTLIVAPTGSGKTEAALLPVLSKIVSANRSVKPIAVLYITPLRALNRDMFRRIESICRALGIKVAIRHGDTSSYARRMIASNPPHILITTPETLSIMLVNEAMRKHLRNVRWVIIDEFHELLGSKRGAHLLADLERLKELAGAFQRIALSASIGNVRVASEALAPGKVVEEVVVYGARRAEIRVEVSGPGRYADIVRRIVDKIRKHGRVLIFTNTRDEAEMLGNKLITYVERHGLGLKIRVHHGSLSKKERKEVEKGLREGRINAVVCTSSLELGIDIGHIDAVIQVGSPKQVTKFLQRIGRSRHYVSGVARGYLIARDVLHEALEALIIGRRSIKGEVEPVNTYRNPLDVLAHVLVGMALEGGYTPKKVCDVLRRSYPFMELDEDDVVSLTNFLSRLRYVRFEGGSFRATKRGKLYYLRTTMIVDAPRYDVVDLTSMKKIGYFDEDFIVMLMDERKYDRDSKFVILAGRAWRIVGVDDDEKKVYVEPPVSISEAEVPFWRGESIPVHYRVAREVCANRRLLAMGYVMQDIARIAGKDVIEGLKRILTQHISSGAPLPSERNIVVEIIGNEGLIVIHTCLGTRGNRALAILLSYVLSKYLGRRVGFTVTPYGIILLTGNISHLSGKGEYTIVRNIINETLKSPRILEELNAAVSNTSMYLVVVSRVLRRMGVIPADASSEVVKALVKRYSRDEVVSREAFNEIYVRFLDKDSVISLSRKLRDGSVKLTYVSLMKPSTIASDLLRYAGQVVAGVVRSSVLPSSTLVELVKRRIQAKEAYMICMMCTHTWVVKVRELPERITCPKCGCGLVAPYFGKDRERVLGIAKRGLSGGRNYKFVLSGEERKIFEELLDSANLVLTYGKKAVEALAMYGVGPSTAKRVLGKEGSDFYMGLYDLERNFIRTRRFWKS